MTGAGGSQELKARTHIHTYARTLTNPKPLIPNPNRRVAPGGSPLRVAGAPRAQADWLLGAHIWRAIAVLFDLLILIAMGKNHNSIGTHRLSSSVSSKLSDHPHLIGKEKKVGKEKNKIKGGHFLQVILFIPEQPENTSLNVNPESFQSLIHQRSEIGTGFGQGGDAPRFRAAHTHTAQRIPENPRAARYPPSAVHQKPERRITPQKSLCQCPYMPRRCS